MYTPLSWRGGFVCVTEILLGHLLEVFCTAADPDCIHTVLLQFFYIIDKEYILSFLRLTYFAYFWKIEKAFTKMLRCSKSKWFHDHGTFSIRKIIFLFVSDFVQVNDSRCNISESYSQKILTLTTEFFYKQTNFTAANQSEKFRKFSKCPGKQFPLHALTKERK